MKIKVNKNYTKIKRETKDYDKIVSLFITLLLSLPLITNFFGGLSLKFFGNTSRSTYFIYALLLILIFYFTPKMRSGRLKFELSIYLSAILVTALNYVLNEKSRIYYSSNSIELLTIFVFYLPIGLKSLFIEKWDYFFRYMKYPVILTPFVTFIGIEYLYFESFMTYMSISNILLPGMLICYYILRVDKKVKYSIIFIFYFYLQLSYGGRMSFFSSLFFIVLIEVIYYKYISSHKKIIMIIFFSVIFITLFAFYNTFIEWFIKSAGQHSWGNSRTVQKLISNHIFSSSGREEIYYLARIELKNMGLSMYGLFGDRIALSKYLPSIIYVHNIFYEMWLSFGWILGSYFLLIVIKKIISNFLFVNNFEVNLMTAFYFCLVCLKLLVSSSFIIEGQFVLMLGMLFNTYNKSYMKKLKL